MTEIRRHPEYKIKPKMPKQLQKKISEKKYKVKREPIGCRAIVPIDDRYDADPTTLNWHYCQKKRFHLTYYCETHLNKYRIGVSSIIKTVK